MFETRYQTFEEGGDPAAVAERIKLLRTELRQIGLDGFIVPRSDRHQNEYVAPADERLAWLTGFTGSAGVAVILAKKAALFVDGRYTVQAPRQTDPRVVKIEPIATTSPSTWIEANLSRGTKLGFDPWLHTTDAVERLATACAAAGAALVPVARNPVDAVWHNRPAMPQGAITLHPERYAGESAAAKLRRIQNALARQQIDVLVVSDPHNLAWTFNIRGSDVAHTPLPLGFAVIPQKGRARLYLADGKLDQTTRRVLEKNAAIHAPSDFEKQLRSLAKANGPS